MRSTAALAAILAIAANAQKGNSPGGKDCQKEDPVIPKDPSVQFNPDNVKWPCDFGNKPIPMGPAPEGCSKYEVIIGQCPYRTMTFLTADSPWNERTGPVRHRRWGPSDGCGEARHAQHRCSWICGAGEEAWSTSQRHSHRRFSTRPRRPAWRSDRKTLSTASRSNHRPVPTRPSPLSAILRADVSSAARLPTSLTVFKARLLPSCSTAQQPEKACLKP